VTFREFFFGEYRHLNGYKLLDVASDVDLELDV